MEAPLLVLTNRLPFTVVRGPGGLNRRPSTGGVISSLDALLRRRGGAWIGWPGLRLRDAESMPGDPSVPYEVAAFHLSELEIAHFYDGFCNRTLWPLFHGIAERARFDEDDWRAYQQVNQRMAATALAKTGRDEVTFVNDYHLLLVPHSLRQQGSDRRVVFFLHIPFPSVDVLQRCPWHRDLVAGLLGSDLLGFQTRRHVDNFLAAAASLPDAGVDRVSMTVRRAGRVTKVGAFPIGADFERFENWARQSPRVPSEPRVVLGVDRLDYTKGLIERLRAFACLLDRHPEHRGRIVLVQIAVPSRPHLAEYEELKRDLERLVIEVNARAGTAGWTPVQYRYESLPQEQLAPLFRNAAVALVTPLSDGMNLVAKEYVASQVDGDGVLVLSTAAGAAETMIEAVTSDPRDIHASASALHRALVMDESERRARMLALRERERSNDLHAWAQRLLGASLS